MYTKSIIQQNIELLQVKNNFRIGIEQLMEKYNIEDSVFVLKNGRLYEAVEGYFSVESDYDSLSEAISNCNIATMGIRVMNNNKFQTGTIHQRISECVNDNQVFDLDRLEAIR